MKITCIKLNCAVLTGHKMATVISDTPFYCNCFVEVN